MLTLNFAGCRRSQMSRSRADRSTREAPSASARYTTRSGDVARITSSFATISSSATGTRSRESRPVRSIEIVAAAAGFAAVPERYARSSIGIRSTRSVTIT
jgi:hypothetical protein